ncbi:hypothetical protein [Cellulomonas sp. URHE0023]|uniref:hypothetical protein n=1 Tax=Cellulomonas sp. URHE0023 TaxID=1380354 RepID=UPI000AC081C6|nr:hypothetical protein [Cellulomonas sp. URHE0023]
MTRELWGEMSDDGGDQAVAVSPTRLRTGVFLVFLWWIPVWLAAPVIAEAFGLDGRDVLIWLIVVQTIVGLAGVLVVGKQIARIMKGVPSRRMLPTVWRVLRRGTIDATG